MKLRIPVWLKSIVLGFIILELGTKIWSILALSNIRLSPKIPWSILIMSIVLWFIWNYLDGKWIPKSTQELRHLWMRANSVEPIKRKWSWVSAVLVGITILFLIIISTKIIDSPSGQIDQIERISIYPKWTILSLIIMTSLVAGIIEEIAFRGYIQKPLELKYSPKIAIIVVALFFTVLHLPNATITPHLMPIFFIGSLAWGILAYLTNSIIPGVVIHCSIDLVSYIWIWRNLDSAKSMASESIMQNGIDNSFIILLMILFISVLALIFSFTKLSKISIGNS